MSPQGQAASEAMIALGRAARCFLIYSPENEAIRLFLQNLRDKVFRYTEQYGGMELTVRPWEMLLGHEVVYVNRDRERSLSFRLFRDGVRKVIFHPEVEWDEITRFLSIISIRFTGVRMHEDDVVTLLWKAGFQHIVIEAVEGFVPEDDETEMEVAAYASSGAANHIHAVFLGTPYQFDLPWPDLTERVRIQYREVPKEDLDRLREEDAALSLPAQCVRLAYEVLEAAANPAEPMQLEEALPIFQEIRDFLLAEGLIHSVLEMVRVIERAKFRKGQEEQKTALLRAFADAKALGRIIHSIPDSAREAPTELLELLDLIPGDKLSALLDILERERSEGSRVITRQLIVREGARRLDYIVKILNESSPEVAVDLLRALAELNPARAAQVALDLVGHMDVAVQLAAVAVLEKAPYDQAMATRIAGMLTGRSVEVRIRAARLLGREKEKWAFQPIVSRLEAGAARDVDPREAEALGEALASIWPRRALHQFTQWIRPEGLLKRVLPGQTMLRWAALAGLVHLPGDEPEELIRWMAKNTAQSDELHRFCMQCLIRRRRVVQEQPRG